jgi:hypothetical protein
MYLGIVKKHAYNKENILNGMVSLGWKRDSCGGGDLHVS